MNTEKNNNKTTDRNIIYEPYIKSVLTKKVFLHITEIGQNLRQNLEKTIISTVEGKCIAEGYIRPSSVRIMTYSSGNISNDYIEFQCVFECKICSPVEGMLIECESKTITKAGIHAHYKDENDIIPLIIFVARDHHNTDKYFNSIVENTKILVRVIGIRFELNDPRICVIGTLLPPNK
jgi:DNA-directed RNA polymerase subunit E'/Rpb7